jgi:hypothetical protein
MSELDDLLTPGPVSSAPPHQRAEVWQRTAKTQRRRRWLRQARVAVVLAAVYGAGMATIAWRTRPAPPAEQGIASIPGAPESRKQPPAPPPDVDTDPYRNDPPHLIERWAALADGRRRVDLYRRAGDLYYERFGDHAAAIRCYRRALDGGTAADLVVQADKDNWLLMSLKAARLKERRDARN